MLYLIGMSLCCLISWKHIMVCDSRPLQWLTLFCKHENESCHMSYLGVAISGGIMKRREALVALRISVGPGLNQSLGNIVAASYTGLVKRCPAWNIKRAQSIIMWRDIFFFCFFVAETASQLVSVKLLHSCSVWNCFTVVQWIYHSNSSSFASNPRHPACNTSVSY